MISGNLFLTLPKTSQNVPRLRVRFVPALGSDRKLFAGACPLRCPVPYFGVLPAGWGGDVTRGCAEAS
jgi:hypothetical protein